jgi:hypothetical protein
MALQGSLRDFSATEILQLLGTQKKTGCLTLENGAEHAVVYVQEGRIVSTRQPGLAKGDPLLAFLRQVHRLSDEQMRGVLTIQRESGRDLEDLLLNGRYLDAEELGACIERQVCERLESLAHWEDGAYRFDPHTRWAHAPLVRLGVEGLIMESARRADERKRYAETFPDPQLVLGVRDLPDPGETLSDEERELFGIIDGQHTLTEVIAAAPLTEFEAFEALHRMHEARWIEIVGRRDPGIVELPGPARPADGPRRRHPFLREAIVAAAVITALLGMRLAARALEPAPHVPAAAAAEDVYAAARMRDLRYALDLYRRERGTFPARLDQLVEDRWLTSDQVGVPGYRVRYRAEREGADYRLELQPAR